MEAVEPIRDPRVFVLVLNWNRCNQTVECLESLDGLVGDHEVVVIDNGSTDGSPEALLRRRPHMRLLQVGENLGYAGGNNRGIAYALEQGADFVWILNNDARPRPGALAALIGSMTPGVGLVSASVQPPELATAVRGGDHIRCTGCAEGFHEADMVLGPSLFVRAYLLREVGPFDERYFHYWEEQDLAMRAYRAGWRLGLACRAVVDHDAGGSLPTWSPQASYYKLRNQLLYEKRFHGRGTISSLFHNRERLRSHLALGTSLADRDSRRVVAVTLAVFDAVRGHVGRRDLGARFQRVPRRARTSPDPHLEGTGALR